MSAARGTAGSRGRSGPRGGNDGVVDDVPSSADGTDDVGGDVAEDFVNGVNQSYDQDELLRCCACHEMVREPALLLLPCLHAYCTACFRAAPPQAACLLCRVDSAASASAGSESLARMSVLLGACSRAAAVAERQCTLCWQSSADGNGRALSAASAFACAAVAPAEHECRQCGLRLCSQCAIWHRRFKRLHEVTAFGDASAEEAADDASGAVPSVQRQLWSSRPLAELRLASAKLAAMKHPLVPQCTRHGLPCDMLCITCERLACYKCLAPSADTDALSNAGTADGGCAGHRVAAVASGEAAEYARRTRTSIEAAMSHVERCLNVALSMFGGSHGKVSSVRGSSASAMAADCNGWAAVAALEAARTADLQRLQANKRLALERVARAHRTAERLLLDAYNALERETPARRSSVLLMSRQLQRARCYAELLGCADDSSLWWQQHPPDRDRCDLGDGKGVGDAGNGDGRNDYSGLSATAFLDQHGSLLACVRKLLRSASAAAAPADGFVTMMVDGGCCEGDAGTECSCPGGCRGEKTLETGKAIENLLLRQWLTPVIFPSTETEATSGTGDHSADDAPCDATARDGVADDVPGCYGADDGVAPAGDLGADSSPGVSAIGAAVAPAPCFASSAIVTMDQIFEEYTALDDANEQDDGGSGCSGNRCVAADLSDERQEQYPTLLTHCVLCEQLLDDPMLLACLHSCCRRCADAVADMSAPRGANVHTEQNDMVYPRVACPVCGVDSRSSALKPNRLATALQAACAASERRLSSDSSAQPASQASTLHCDVCIDVGEKSEARLTCYVCKQCYCEPCELRHRALNARHSIGPVVAATATIIRQQQPLLYTAAAQSCQLGDHDMFCIDCDALRCHFCGKQCIERRHDLAAIDGQRMVSLAHEAADRLRRSAAAVAELADQASVAATSCAIKLPAGEDVIAASSDASLLLVANRARTAVSYCGSLLSSPDVALVLDQMSSVASCLETLRSEFEARTSGVRRNSRSTRDRVPADC